jgi:hypothetical protein
MSESVGAEEGDSSISVPISPGVACMIASIDAGAASMRSIVLMMSGERVSEPGRAA